MDALEFADLVGCSRDSCRFLLCELLIFEFGEVGEVLVYDEDVLFFEVLLILILSLRGNLSTRKGGWGLVVDHVLCLRKLLLRRWLLWRYLLLRIVRLLHRSRLPWGRHDWLL